MSRLQLALDVDDLDRSVAFYRTLFAVDPVKVEPGYANFALEDPPLKLILVESPGRGGSINHLGIEVESTDAVDAEQHRLADAGFAAVPERETVCCYAKQDKFWVQDTPNGEQWEVYPVLADSATERQGRRVALLAPRWSDTRWLARLTPVKSSARRSVCSGRVMTTRGASSGPPEGALGDA